MDEEPEDYPPNAAVDLLMVLIAELQSRGALGKDGLESMASRLDLTEHTQLAERLRLLPFSLSLERAFRDGGNGQD